MSRPHKRKFLNNNEKKEKYNSTISLAIGEIIRFSTDDDFRSKCFQLMKVNNTNDFQHVIKKKLDSLTDIASKGTNIATLPKRSVFQDTLNMEQESLPGPSCSTGALKTNVNIEDQIDKVITTSNHHTVSTSKTNEIYFPVCTNEVNIFNLPYTGTERKIANKSILMENSGAVVNPCNESPCQTNEEVYQPKINDKFKDDPLENVNGFWPNEQCCLWNYNLIQGEIDLNDNDTEWK